MHVEHLWLKDFRSYPSVDLELTSGLCAVLGPNGMGKSNLLEAVGYLALLESFRGAPTDALIRSGTPSAVVRGAVRTDEREQLIEAELVASGRNRIQVNRQRLTRTRDLLGAVRITVFSPDDLALIKGGPGLRRSYLDQLLVSLDPRNDALRSELERALRAAQRPAEADQGTTRRGRRAHPGGLGRQGGRCRRGAGPPPGRAGRAHRAGGRRGLRGRRRRAGADRAALRGALAGRRAWRPHCRPPDPTSCGGV